MQQNYGKDQCVLETVLYVSEKFKNTFPVSKLQSLQKNGVWKNKQAV